MLILTRKLNEKIMIGDDIVIVISQINRNNVSVGIDAPIDVPVHRSEIYDRIQEEKNDNETGVE